MPPQPGKRFKARFTTTPCILCPTRIEAGDIILWIDDRGQGYVHTNCYDGTPGIARAPEEIVTRNVDGEKLVFDIEDARRYIADVRWQFAKTMPRNPHEYTKRVWAPNDRAFEAFVELIRSAGVEKPWPTPPAKERMRQVYLVVDDWQYWTMGAPLEETIIINRARISDPTTA